MFQSEDKTTPRAPARLWSFAVEHTVGGPVRILVVDDYPDIAELTCELVKMLGHDCRIALSGEEALLQVEQFVPDLAILDLDLSLSDLGSQASALDGYDLCRTLRARFANRIVLVALTGWKYSDAKAIAAGFDHHLLKPATHEELSTMIAIAERLRCAVPLVS
jgi:CheY-like chemotaxis protein